MKFERNLVFSLALIAVAGSARAEKPLSASESFECPPAVRIESVQATAAKLPEGARIVAVPGRSMLEGIGVYDGPPEWGGALKPLDGDASREAPSHWRFEGEFPEGKWLACTYGDGVLQVVRRIGDRLTTCVGSFHRDDIPAKRRARFDCR